MIVITAIASWLGLATALIRGRTPVVLKQVDRATLSQHWLIAHMIPEAATDITVWYTPNGDGDVLSRFHMRNEDLAAWIGDKSEKFSDATKPTGNLRVFWMWDAVHVIEGDGNMHMKGKLPSHIQIWVSPWGSGDGGRVVFYDSKNAIVQMSIMDFVPRMTIEEVE